MEFRASLWIVEIANENLPKVLRFICPPITYKPLTDTVLTYNYPPSRAKC